MLNRIAFIVIALFIVACQQLDEKQALEVTMTKVQKEYELPALSIVIVSLDQILFQHAEGVRSIEQKDSITLHHAFHIGSNTKAFFASVCVQLVEKDIIHWETKVLDIFPEFISTSNSIYRNITLKDLLEHRAGIKGFTQKEEVLKLPDYIGLEREKRRAFVQWLLQQPSDYVGSFEYSNGGYAVACAMIEKVMGQSWRTLMQHYLFDSLQLKANFGWPINTQKNGIWGHYFSEDTDKLVAHNGEDYRVNALIESAGNLNMTGLDFGKYLQFLLKQLNNPTSEITKAIAGNQTNYTLGWHKRTHQELAMLEHFGSAGTFHSYAGIVKEKEMAFVILTNVYSPQSKTALEDLREVIVTKIKQDQFNQ